MPSRPPFRPLIAIRKPSPASPSSRSAGTRTPSSTTWRVGWAFHPIFFSFGPNDSPGSSRSTRNAEIPRGPSPPVRASTMYRCDAPAPEMNCFVPVSTYASPSRTARVRSAAASEPAPGSVRQ